MPNLDGIQYFLLAGFGAIIGLMICLIILLPLSLIWPAVWDASIWIMGGCTVAGLVFGAVIE